jgi:hypothetical protein
MRVDRRTLLLGMGLVAVMTGMVFGTGAFTQVEAERTVDVDVADDADAFLGLYETTGNYTAANGGTVAIQLNDSSAASGIGVNDDAVTTVDSVINVSNQGTQPVDVSVGNAPQGINLTGLPATDVGVGDNVTVGVNVSTNPNRPINGGTVSSDVQESITINATAG